ncbi:MAG: class I SAM-dependent methyltransferase [Actinomycetota bacterium]|nr:class I SAM-dependent methyltransferase [Actinomycetota bacterium]
MDVQEVAQHIARYWDLRSSTFDEEHDTEDKQAWMQTLSGLLGYDRTRNVLDVGTGSGFLANMTAELGFPSIGVDISTGMMRNGVRRAAQQGVGTVFMKVPAVELPFMDATIDRIVNARLIWTMVASDDMASEWFRVLRPGGEVFCFNRMDPENGLRRPDRGKGIYDDPDVDDALDLHDSTCEELVRFLEASGFEGVGIEHLPGLTRPGFDYQDWYVLRGRKPAG